MKGFVIAAVFAAALVPTLLAAQSTPPAAPATPPPCQPSEGNIRFICASHAAAEDLAYIPGSHWIVTSGFSDQGGIRLIDTSDLGIRVLFPSPDVAEDFDSKTYDNCPGPLAAEDKALYISQGNSLKPNRNGSYTLYSVHRGQRESFEVFRLQPRGDAPPKLTWIGCVLAPNDWVRLNSVVGLPDGGIVATNFNARPGTKEAADNQKKAQAGENNGFIWEWHSGKGWTQLPFSAGSGLNGIEVSKDGKWLYVDEYNTHNFFRLSRGVTPVRRDSIAVGFLIDNVKWAPDGRLIAAGATEHGSRVIKIDPKTLKMTVLLDIPESPTYNRGSVAIQVGQNLWLGTVRSDAIGVTPLPK